MSSDGLDSELQFLTRLFYCVEHPPGPPFRLVAREPMSSDGLDRELQFVTRLVDCLAPGERAEGRVTNAHIEGGEQKVLCLMEVEELRQPPQQEGRDVVRTEQDLDFPDRPDRVQVRDQAEHALRGVHEQLRQVRPERPNADVRRMVDLLVPHAYAKG